MIVSPVGRCRPPAGDPSPRFWERVCHSRHRLLMLDYDGTLAPFRLERSQAQIPPAVQSVLRRLASGGGTRLAVISGRPVSELERLVGPLAAELVGEYGWERRSAEGRPSRRRLPFEVTRGLERAARAARASGWGPHLERKRCSLVLHTRGLPVETARELEFECERLWRTYFEGDSLRLHRLHGGVTLRASGRHKGTAVAELMAQSPPDTLAVYIGDDSADADAFREVAERGVAIRVGTAAEPAGAEFRLASVEDVGSFLEHWETVTQEAGSASGAPDEERGA